MSSFKSRSFSKRYIVIPQRKKIPYVCMYVCYVLKIIKSKSIFMFHFLSSFTPFKLGFLSAPNDLFNCIIIDVQQDPIGLFASLNLSCLICQLLIEFLSVHLRQHYYLCNLHIHSRYDMVKITYEKSV